MPRPRHDSAPKTAALNAQVIDVGPPSVRGADAKQKTKAENTLMTKNARQDSNLERHGRDGRPEGSDLDRNYRGIGISAVAAAVRYASGARNPAPASDENEHAA
jgi:hypothetical protein